MAASLPTLPRVEGLREAELRSLLEHAVQRTVPRNTILMAEGDENDAVFFVLTGQIKVFLSDADGKEVVIDFQGPGEYFGEMALEPGGRSASVMTMEPSRLAVVKMADFRRFLLAYPEFQLALVRRLIQRVRVVDRPRPRSGVARRLRSRGPHDRESRPGGRRPPDRTATHVAAGHCESRRRLAGNGLAHPQGIARGRIHRDGGAPPRPAAQTAARVVSR